MTAKYDDLFDKLVEADNVPETVKALKNQLLEYLEFIEQVMDDNPRNFTQEQKEDLSLVYTLFSKMDPVLLMEKFVKNVLPYSEQIRNRNEDYFQKNVMKLFSSLPQEKVYFVYDLFVKGKIDREDLECNWDYWNTFIELAEKNKKTRKDSPTQINKQITLPNKGRLANILQDNVRINRKLDDDEVQRADIELKKIDNSGRNVIRNIYNLI